MKLFSPFHTYFDCTANCASRRHGVYFLCIPVSTLRIHRALGNTVLRDFPIFSWTYLFSLLIFSLSLIFYLSYLLSSDFFFLSFFFFCMLFHPSTMSEVWHLQFFTIWLQPPLASVSLTNPVHADKLPESMTRNRVEVMPTWLAILLLLTLEWSSNVLTLRASLLTECGACEFRVST